VSILSPRSPLEGLTVAKGFFPRRAIRRCSLDLLLPRPRIVNIITVRCGGNLDRCKTTSSPRRSARRACTCVYVHAFGCKRLANETFRFTKSSESREPREWGRKSPRPDVNIPPSRLPFVVSSSSSARALLSSSAYPTPPVGVLQILLHRVVVAVLKAMAVKRHSGCPDGGPNLARVFRENATTRFVNGLW
jgi:hypothetical protein